MDEQKVADIPQIGEADNEILFAPFTKKEVLEAIGQMKNNKARGPDGVSSGVLSEVLAYY